VKNVGSAPAGYSRTTVDFGTRGSSAQTTTPLVAGASTDLSFELPTGLEDDFQLTVYVDSTPHVDETNEGNNKAQGNCVG
jgi:subtilase family serine protease